MFVLPISVQNGQGGLGDGRDGDAPGHGVPLPRADRRLLLHRRRGRRLRPRFQGPPFPPKCRPNVEPPARLTVCRGPLNHCLYPNAAVPNL